MNVVSKSAVVTNRVFSGEVDHTPLGRKNSVVYYLLVCSSSWSCWCPECIKKKQKKKTERYEIKLSHKYACGYTVCCINCGKNERGELVERFFFFFVRLFGRVMEEIRCRSNEICYKDEWGRKKWGKPKKIRTDQIENNEVGDRSHIQGWEWMMKLRRHRK